MDEAISREEAILLAERAFKPAHTYSSENAGTYRIYDNGQRRAISHIVDGLRALPSISPPAETMPILPFICEKCGVRQYADGKCANCGAKRLRPQLPSPPADAVEAERYVTREVLWDWKGVEKLSMPDLDELVKRIAKHLAEGKIK